MTAPSLVRLARNAPDALAHVCRMAGVMRDRKSGPEGACTVVHLFQAGFTEAQVVAYRDPARALLQSLPTGLNHNPPGRLEAKLALQRVPEIRAGIAERAAEARPAEEVRPAWSAPRIEERGPAGVSA